MRADARGGYEAGTAALRPATFPIRSDRILGSSHSAKYEKCVCRMTKSCLTIALVTLCNTLHATSAGYRDLGTFKAVAYSYKAFISDECNKKTCFVHLRTVEKGVTSDFGGMIFCERKQLMIMLKSPDGDVIEGTGTMQKIHVNTPGQVLYERLCL